MRKKSYLEIFGNERKIKYIRFLNEYRNILLPKKYNEYKNSTIFYIIVSILSIFHFVHPCSIYL